ncbi:MAG: hypothetical protein IT318_11320 [Anaerolineales bacterium]|nr:hypothetical protein [Anaerolineales bacterium]
MRPDAVSGQRWLPGFALLGLAIVYLWPLALNPAGVAFHPRSDFTDLLISHWPNAAYVRDSLATYGQWPLWNVQLFAGQPFVADPLSGTWYPPNLLLLVLPLALAFNLLWALHLAWAGLGLYALLRAEAVGGPSALVAAAAFVGTPKLLAHIGAGHVSLVYAVSWTPWLLLAVRAAARQGGWRRGARAGAVLAVIFLADVRWAFYAGGLAVAFALACLVRSASFEPGTGTPVADIRTSRAAVKAHLSALAAFIGTAGLLAAPLAVPLMEFVTLSRRAALTLAEASAMSLPPVYLAGLLIPDLGGFQEWMTYVGVAPLLLALAGLRRGAWFWGGAVLFAAAFALGTNFVLYPWLYRVVPGVGLLRVPPRAWFVVALSLCVLAGHGAHRLTTDWLPRLAERYAARGLRLPSARTLILALFAVTVLDLLRVGATLLEARPMPAIAPAAAWLRRQPGLFRVYSPSYSLAPGDGLQHLDGVDPLYLAASATIIEQAIGVRASGYSVTIPAFATSDLAREHASAQLDAHRLGRLDVRFVAAEFPIAAPGFELVETFGATRIYANTQWAARAWAEGGTAPSIAAWTPNRIVVAAEGPGTLVLSEVAYPGWRVTIDGQAAALQVADGVWQAAVLPPGRHEVVFVFRPASVEAGLLLGVAGLVGVVLSVWRPGRQSG